MLTPIIIYLQVFFGKIVNYLAKEEIQQGKKYFIFAKNLLLIITSLILFYLTLELNIMIPIVLGFIIFSYFRNIYFLIGLAVLSASLTINPILPLSFILLFTLLYSSLSKFKIKEIVLATVYFSIPFVLIFLETFVKANLSIFSGLAIGGLLAQLKGP